MVFDRVSYLLRSLPLKVFLHAVLTIGYCIFGYYVLILNNSRNWQVGCRHIASVHIHTRIHALAQPFVHWGTPSGSPFLASQSHMLLWIKGLWLALSARQIVIGFPKTNTTGWLTRNRNAAKEVLYIAFRGVPFVFEMKSLLDWTFTATTLMFDGMKCTGTLNVAIDVCACCVACL